MEDNGYRSLDEIEQQARERDYLFHIGRPIWEEIAELEREGDRHALDVCLSELASEERRALQYMNERNDRVVDEIHELQEDNDPATIELYIERARPVDRKMLATQFAGLERHLQSLTNGPSKAVRANGHEPQSSRTDSGVTSADNPPIDKLFDEWLLGQTQMANSSFGEFKRMGRFFVSAVTELNNDRPPTASQLTGSLIRAYKDALSDIPKGVRTDGKTLAELRQLTGQPKSRTTINGTLTNVATFLRWIKGEGYAIPDESVQVLTHTRRVRSSEKKRRIPWDDGDLSKMFGHHRYTKGTWRRSSEFWAPLIALFTGCTMGEILQLEVGDIHEDKINAIDINDNGTNKRLKVTESLTGGDGRPRLMPIHAQLIKLGS